LHVNDECLCGFYCRLHVKQVFFCCKLLIQCVYFEYGRCLQEVFMKIHAKIQKWGNGLALRIAGLVRDIPHFEEGTEVDIDINDEGFTLKKSKPSKKIKLPYSEADLLKNMSAETAHADELAILGKSEI